MAATTAGRRRPAIESRIQLRSEDVFREWLFGFARFRQSTVTACVHEAVVALAKAEGYRPEAPRR